MSNQPPPWPVIAVFGVVFLLVLCAVIWGMHHEPPPEDE